jgi:hypothetical protein
MSAGPGPPRFVRYRSPAAAPRQAARAGTLLLSEVRRPVLPAGARSPVAPPTLPALHRQPQHAAALATPHPSTGSAPPRFKGAGPPKAGLVPAFLSPAANTPSHSARVSRTPESFAPPVACCNALEVRPSAHVPCQLLYNQKQRIPIPAGPTIQLRNFDGWRGGGNNNFMSAHGAFQITFRLDRRAGGRRQPTAGVSGAFRCTHSSLAATARGCAAAPLRSRRVR